MREVRRHRIVVAFASGLLAVSGFAHADRVPLRGTIVDGATTAPIKGAEIFVWSARPREGVPILCPGCYADCGKRATSDEKGSFEVESVDDSLDYRLLIIAKGYQSIETGLNDPREEPATFALGAAFPAAPDEQAIWGRVVDEDGKPIARASVQPFLMSRVPDDAVDRRPMPKGPELVLTDEDGRYRIEFDTPNVCGSLRVGARGFAPTVQIGVFSGRESEPVELSRGAIVRGRLVHDGKPVPHAMVGLAQTMQARRSSFLVEPTDKMVADAAATGSRHMGTAVPVDRFLGEFTIGTNENGEFTFTEVPWGDRYWLYGKASTLPQPLASKPREVALPGHASAPDGVVDVGELVLTDGLSVRGRVLVDDPASAARNPPTAGSVLLGADELWDSQLVAIGADGAFAFEHVVPGTYSLAVRVPGHVLSTKNASLDPLNPIRLMGRVDGDVGDLRILVEPGKEPHFSRVAQPTGPLRGVEERPTSGTE